MYGPMGITQPVNVMSIFIAVYGEWNTDGYPLIFKSTMYVLGRIFLGYIITFPNSEVIFYTSIGLSICSYVSLFVC